MVTNFAPLFGYGNLTACGNFNTAVYSTL
jgi:hypothetical protein